MSNLDPDNINQARSILENSKSILLAVVADPSLDRIAGALALYLSLSASGKQVSLICPTEMTVEYNELVGIDKVSTALKSASGRNLIISFPYQEGSIEKVSYNIENNSFNLVIEPREGYPTITPEMMQYNFSNGNFDSIVTLGCTNLDNLGQLYSSNKNFYHDKPIVNISNTNSQPFGKVNLLDSSISSFSELILEVMNQMGLSIEPDMATNLLAGLMSETNNFSSPTTSAGTFETAALLLKHGAKKIKIRPGQPAIIREEKRTSIPSSPTKGFSPFGKRSAQPFGQQDIKSSARQPSWQVKKPVTSPQQPRQPRQPQQPFGKSPQAGQTPSVREAGKPPETPPDWLKPKIYKGSTLL